MKYILMMNTMKASQGIPNWPKADLQAHIAFMKSLNKELRESSWFLRKGYRFQIKPSSCERARMECRLPTAYFRNPKNFLLASGSSMSPPHSGPTCWPHESRRRPGLKARL
jgi:hypothetical protein